MAVVAATSVARAQSTSWLRGSAGIEQAAQRNSAESPYVYQGYAAIVSLGYGLQSTTSAFDVAIGGGAGNLSSATTGASASRFDGQLDLRWLRQLSWSPRGTHWMLGAAATAHADATDHQYAAYGTDDAFGYLDAGIGPAVRTSFGVRHATVTNDLDVPLLNWIDLPYSNAKSQGATLALAYASPAAQQTFDDAVSYRVGGDDSRSLVWTYRVALLRYRRDDLRVFARQSFSVGFNLPLRRGAR